MVDWGTTALRAALVDQAGRVADEIENDGGIQHIKDRNFEDALLQAIQPWLSEHGALTVVALGMITSRNGWVEVPYIACPATVADLASGIKRRKLRNGSELVFLAGITDATRNPFPDVMRGEETQIVGYGLRKPAVVVLPGTHSKWASVSGNRIERFQTFVTGEIFALLSQHSFIAQTGIPADGKIDWAAFERGVAVAENATGSDAVFLTQLFSARTGMLANQLPVADIRDYVSGVLIGNEFREARESGWFEKGDTIGVVGNDGLNARYTRAAQVFGLTPLEGGTQAAIRGALEIFAEVQPSSGVAA